MRRSAITAITLLLASPPAEATVYVWKDADALVMTNDSKEVPARVDEDELTTYATAATTTSEESPKRLVTVRGEGTEERPGAEEKPQPGPAGVVTSPTAAAPDPAAAAAAPKPGDQGAAAGSSRGSLEGWRVDPRSLFERKRAPGPQFIVSVVEPSAGPLSTSLRETRPSISSTGSSGVNGQNFPR